MSLQKPINTYTCPKCSGFIVTLDREEGVTPMMLRCRASKGCDGMMESAFYMADQTLTPSYEWRKPTKGEYLRMRTPMREHIDRGGLEIYPIRPPAERENPKRDPEQKPKRSTPKQRRLRQRLNVVEQHRKGKLN
jgi:hypothetical protein